MPRQSRIHKKIQTAVRDEPKKPRKKREAKQLPIPFKQHMAVRVSAKDQFIGYKLGRIAGPCKWDEGIIVNLTNPTNEEVAEYVCIQVAHGDTIVGIEKDV